MVLPAPGRFSTITGTFHFSFSRCASARATVSMLPPASNGTTILTVWSGNSALAARGESSMPSRPASIDAILIFMQAL